MKKNLLLILLFAFGSAFPQQNLWQKASEDRLNGSEKLDR